VREFIVRYTKELGGKVDEILPLKIKLPPTYHFHKRDFMRLMLIFTELLGIENGKVRQRSRNARDELAL
jgi:predicted RNA methylase